MCTAATAEQLAAAKAQLATSNGQLATTKAPLALSKDGDAAAFVLRKAKGGPSGGPKRSKGGEKLKV